MKLRYTLAAAAVLVAIPATVQAGPREDVLEALGKCADMTANAERWACYDRLAPQVKAALATPPSVQTLANGAPPTPQDQQSWFGFDIGDIFGTAPNRQTTPQQFGSEALPPPPAPPGAPPPQPQTLDSISANVTEFALTPFGRFVIFLDNGQVWRQLEGDADMARFDKHGKNRVTISRGMLGSYNLHLNDSSRTYKVKRIK